ncbi:MAG: D-alanyl-D-alanine carboxypeptidase/D-alanyl-D-alanine-endopeptidase [Gemmatimonadaceae bacterium]|nr:D-alanyl-D-alanine carboxypeptidase/D-alanyl-D-alanine-endopeptidase [Gemmatimonadaceae bacterium]
MTLPRVSLRPAALALFAALAGCASLRGGRATEPVRELRRATDSLLAQPRFRSAALGVLVVDPARGDTLVSRNAGKLFIPASNQKLLTGAVALTQLGPDFRFSTSVFADGPIADGVVFGNLRFEGMGDPSMSDHMAGDAMRPLRALADSLAARGVVRIRGALVPGRDAFPDATWGFGWAWDDVDFAYSAGVDELYFNEGFLAIDVIGGRSAGELPAMRVRPNPAFPNVRVQATTVERTTPGERPRVRASHDSTDALAVIVDGAIAIGDSQRVELTHRDQARAWLEAARTALRDRGILVDGGIGERTPAPPTAWTEPAGTLLFSVASPPLSEILVAFEKPSQNQIGEILLKSLGRAKRGAGTADSGARVVRDQLVAWGAAPDGFVVRDGSGLSRHNVVTPATIITVLDAMRQGPLFETFRRALPIAGVDGTIGTRMRGTPAQGNVHAKTGTLDMVRSLSGYVTTADGRLLLFSLLANNFTVPTREVDALHEAIAVRLSQLGGRR